MPVEIRFVLIWVAFNTPVCKVKEEMELPVYCLTVATPEDNCWADRFVTRAVVIVKFVPLTFVKVACTEENWNVLSCLICASLEYINSVFTVSVFTVSVFTTFAMNCPVCDLSEEILFVRMLLAVTLSASNMPIWPVKEDIELPVYWFTVAIPEENCSADTVVAFVVVVSKEPICAVTEEMELPVYWLTVATPEENC